MAPQELGLVGQVGFDRLTNAIIEELGLRRGVEVSVQVRGVIQYTDVSIIRCPPFDDGQEAVGMALERMAIGVDLLQNRRRNREHDARRNKLALGQHMVDQVAVYSPLAIFEWMGEDEAE